CRCRRTPRMDEFAPAFLETALQEKIEREIAAQLALRLTLDEGPEVAAGCFDAACAEERQREISGDHFVALRQCGALFQQRERVIEAAHSAIQGAEVVGHIETLGCE